MEKYSLKRQETIAWIITIILTGTSLAWVMPIVIVLFNSLKDKGSIALETFKVPNAETYVGDYAIYRSAQKGVGTSRIVVN